MANSDTLSRWNTAKKIPRESTQSNRSGLSNRAVSSERATGYSERTTGYSEQPDQAPQRGPQKAEPKTSTGTGTSIPRMDPRSVARAGEQGAAAQAEPSNQTVSAEEFRTRAQELFEEKREARRQRRELKESGDYLGVQGVNPLTGELDIYTPSNSDPSAIGSTSREKLEELNQQIREAQAAYTAAKHLQDEELREMRSRRNIERLDVLEKAKAAIKGDPGPVRRRRREGQWSSVAEPQLSPIAGSVKSYTASLGEST